MRRRAQHIIGRSRYGLWGLLLALLASLLMMGSLPTARAAHAVGPNGSMHVVVPAPSTDNKTVQGPVHTNVSVSAGQATAGATYLLGWAKPSDGCDKGFNAFTDSSATVTADDSGNFTATFAWPDAANNTGALYLICAVDAANPTTSVITADQQFQVLGATAPQITLSQAPVPTPTGTAASTPAGKGYYAGGPVQVRGKGFLPVGTAVAFFLTTSATFSPQDFQPDHALKTEDGSQVLSNSQGQFTTIIILPDIITGQLYLHAVSTDAQTDSSQPLFPPSLVATRGIQVSEPLPTPTAQPSPTPDTSKTGQTTNNGDKTTRIVAIATLGVLSLVLFIIGAILIASVALGPGKPPAPESGTRSQPGATRSNAQW